MEEDNLRHTSFEASLTANVRTVIIVRHAESLANSQGIYQGQTYDTGLSELGKKQAKALAKRIESLGVRKIISSPLKRTYQTAKEIVNYAKCDIKIDETVVETNHGLWEGKHKSAIVQKYPDVFSLWLKKPSETVFPGGESFSGTVRRTFDFLVNTDFGKRTLVITHDNIIRVMISLISNTDIDDMWKIEIETASLNFFEVNKVNKKNLFRTLKLNDVEHLEGLRNDITNHAL